MAADPVQSVVSTRSFPWRKLMFLPWALVGGVTLAVAAGDPQPLQIAVPALLGAAFIATSVQRRLSDHSLHRSQRQLEMRLDNASYLNEFQNLPNRNYMLDQLRREMPRSRHTREPFVVVAVSVTDLDGIAARRGPEFADLAARSLARLIERFTRASDFAAELGPGSFGILLYECDQEMAESYLRRVPGVLAVSTGKRMLEIPLLVRISEYDMESIYAIDVLREAEEAELARDPEPLRFGGEVA
ncbi:MAG: diguanylate cyclase [Dehalococcoidia bacterium]